MNRGRLEAFTDAVIAIAATIMVLELRPPKSVSLRGLAADWPIMVAYVFSFTMIYVVWYSHHNLFNKAKIISTRTYLFNGLWLFSLTLVPASTAWVGQHADKTLPEVVYLGVLLLWSLAFQLMDESVIKDNPGISRDVSNNVAARLWLYGGYVAGILVALVWPIGALLIVGGISLGLTGQLLRTKPTPVNK
ncbi:TMEM175 family protein [Lacticaseibacillus yichunensis]|uniref:TMEM175 family protein n=1 Tax=Lacticaseibacillus yichunensis TaxID=2486015 RepID=A0ABW4CN77_9LACO|nr:TMEM175 family protein [Lacticaseibacillus yichunensis]